MIGLISECKTTFMIGQLLDWLVVTCWYVVWSTELGLHWSQAAGHWAHLLLQSRHELFLLPCDWLIISHMMIILATDWSTSANTVDVNTCYWFIVDWYKYSLLIGQLMQITWSDWSDLILCLHPRNHSPWLPLMQSGTLDERRVWAVIGWLLVTWQ